MGVCGENINKRKEDTQINKNNKNNKSIQRIGKRNKKDRVKEGIIKTSSPFEKINDDLSNISRAICKIKIEYKLGRIMGTGFLLKFNIEKEMFYCLISNEHVIKNDILQDNNTIILLSYDNEFKNANIKLGNKKRYIKSYIDIDLDITLVEILDEDNIIKDYFLFPELENMVNNKLINNKIYIPQYAGGKELVNGRGIIKEINRYEFTHLVNTEKGSSGSPIFLENSTKVIGIHKEGHKDKTENYGDFIYPVINIIKNDIKRKRNNGKYIYEDGEYYIGEFKNCLFHGKGIFYYSNGNILYDGEFVKNEFEGIGKLILEKGDYYIGEFKMV